MNRFVDYDKEHCWQYEVKMQTLQEDLSELHINPQDIQLYQLEFRHIPSEDQEGCKHVRDFIERYEWLGKLPVWVTHRFAAFYGDIMVGAIVMSTPNRFSNLLGEEYKNREKLISRGATISFAPKNMASWIIMKSILWMVRNTDFVLFTAYADPKAKELGTVYQACNFYYLGNWFGDAISYVNCETGKSFGSSYFAQRSVIKKASILYGVDWKKDYVVLNAKGNKRIINWSAMSDAVKAQVRDALGRYKSEYFNIVKSMPKHKYAYVKAKTVGGTKKLVRLIEERNMIYPYPKERGK